MRVYNNLPRKAWILIARNQFLYRVETLYNTVVIVRWDNIIFLYYYAVAKWSAAGQGFQNNDWQPHIFLKLKESKEW